MTNDNLLEILAAISRKDGAQIQDSTPLNSLLAGSLGRAKLFSALQFRCGISEPRIYQAATVSQLRGLLGLDGNPAASNGSRAPLTETAFELQTMPGDVQLGVDLESIADLPIASDYWEEDFYKSTFTPSEIAYALLQSAPRESFAAMWCAKEALRKAVAAFATIDWTRIEVAHDTNGKPSLKVDGKPLAGALSLSHTRDYAVAVFNAHSNGQPAPAPDPIVASSAQEQPARGPQRGGKLIVAISLLSLLFSIVALLSTMFLRK
ncbi:MAG: holo-ACP synthase [Terracidiphilus sp.]